MHRCMLAPRSGARLQDKEHDRRGCHTEEPPCADAYSALDERRHHPSTSMCLDGIQALVYFCRGERATEQTTPQHCH